MTETTKILITAVLVAAVILVGLYWYKTTYQSNQGQPEQQQEWNNWEIDGNIFREPKSEPEKPIGPPKSYEEALKQAEQTGQNIFLFFSADWCSACRKMKQETLSKPEVQKVLEDFVVWFVNTDENQDLAEKYNVKHIPAYFVVTGSEKIEKQAKGYQSAKKFLEWLN